MSTVKPYDLCRPKGLDRNDVRLLRNQLATFARHASIEISGMLRRSCSLSLTGDLESTWREFAEMMDKRPYLGLFTLSPLSGTAVLAMPKETAIRVLELRLGGGQRPPYSPYNQLTDCDYSVIGSVVSGVVGVVASTFGKNKKVSATLTRQITDAAVRDLIGQFDMFLVGCFNLTLGEDKPIEMFIALPFGLVHQLSETLRAAEAVALTEEAPMSGTTVMTVPLVVNLQLPPIELTPETVAALDIGDVIRTHHPISQPLELQADGIHVARARIGRSRSRLACVIVEDNDAEREVVAPR